MNLGTQGCVCVEGSVRGNERNNYFLNGNGELPPLIVGSNRRFPLALLEKNGCGQPVLICVLSNLVWSLGSQIGQVMHSPFKRRPLPFAFLFHLLSLHITLLLCPFLFSFIFSLNLNHLFLYGLNMVLSVPLAFELV